MTNDELRSNFESLHANLAQLFEQSQKHDAQIAQLITLVAQDAENIRSLVRVAELHHERLNRLEGDQE